MNSETVAQRPVMLVEDDADIRAMIVQLLELEGYRVLSFADGGEALAVLRSGEEPGLILLDLMMPAMSGWQFRAELSQDARLEQFPVVVISGGRAAREALEGFPAAAFLKKPIDLDVLLTTVQRFARR